MSGTGRFQIVEGRAATGDDEVVANEVLLERTGLRVGDRVVVTFWGEDELGLFGPDGTVLHGPQVEVEIVGVGRGLTDLTAVEEDFAKAEASGAALQRGTRRANRGCRGLQRRARRGGRRRRRGRDRRHRGGVRGTGRSTRRPRWAPTRPTPSARPSGTRRRRVIALGLIMALVVATFIGQAVVRQSRREWSDGPILRAIGVTGREGGAAALLRGAAIGVPAAVRRRGHRGRAVAVRARSASGAAPRSTAAWRSTPRCCSSAGSRWSRS